MTPPYKEYTDNKFRLTHCPKCGEKLKSVDHGRINNFGNMGPMGVAINGKRFSCSECYIKNHVLHA